MSIGDHCYTCTDDTRSVNVVAWSPDGRYLAVGSSGMNVRIYEAQTWDTVKIQDTTDSSLTLLPNRPYVWQRGRVIDTIDSL